MDEAELERWLEMKRLLGRVCDSIAGAIGDKEADLVREFLDNNEYGVAYDWMVSSIEELQIALNGAASADLARAAHLMGLGPLAHSS